jgi:AcrR family transcriptional regulator
MSDDRSPRRRQSRDELLAALRPVFAERGFDGASLSQLAAASGLGKASLYHHFPGGKNEMAAVLLREAVARLERLAFARLNTSRPATDRLRDFVDGFRDYVSENDGICLIAALNRGGGAELHGETIARQYADWQQRLATVFAEAGFRNKKSRRLAGELLAALYGHLETARLLRTPDAFDAQARRVRKALPS